MADASQQQMHHWLAQVTMASMNISMTLANAIGTEAYEATVSLECSPDIEGIDSHDDPSPRDERSVSTTEYDSKLPARG